MNTEEIRTTVVWDTAGVDRGLQRVESALSRMDKDGSKSAQSDKERQAKTESAKKDILAQANNRFAQNLKDAEALEKASYDRRLEGDRKLVRERESLWERARARMTGQGRSGERAGGAHGADEAGHRASGGSATRFVGDGINMLTGSSGSVSRLGMLSHLGVGAMAGGVATAGVGMIAKLIGDHVGELKENDTAAGRMRGEFDQLGHSARYANTGQGAEALSGQIDKFREHRTAVEEYRGDLYRLQQKQEGGGFLYKAADRIRNAAIFGGGMTTEQKINEADQQSKVSGQWEEKLRGQRTGAYRHAAGTAAERLNGSDFNAQRMELDLAQQKETSEARSHEVSKEDLALIKQKFDIERERISRTELASRVQLATETRALAIRINGNEVETRTARMRVQEAQAAQRAAIGSEQRQAAANRVADAKLELDIVSRQAELKKGEYRIDRETAEFRGNADDAAIKAASALIEKAKEAKIAARTDAEKRQADLQFAQAQGSAVQLVRQQAVQRITSESAAKSGRTLLGASARVLEGDQEGAQKAQLEAQVEAAKEALAAAEKRAAVEKDSLASLDAQRRAIELLGHAQIDLASHVREVNRTRRDEMGTMKTETAAMRMQNAGRGDRAQLMRDRQANGLAVADAIRNNRPEVAAELQEQQAVKEQGLFDDKFLGPDGRPRNRAVVAREEREANATQRRFEGANKRLEENRGMVNGHWTGPRKKGLQSGNLDTHSGSDPKSRAGQGLTNFGGLGYADFPDELHPRLAKERMGEREEGFRSRFHASPEWRKPFRRGGGTPGTGIVEGIDPLTRERVSPAALYLRKNGAGQTGRNDAASGSKEMHELLKSIDEKLGPPSPGRSAKRPPLLQTAPDSLIPRFAARQHRRR